MIKTYTDRPQYMEKLRPFMRKDIIKALVGQRRVGKSCLLQQIMGKLKRRGAKSADIIYINKELHEFAGIRDHADLLSYIRKKTRGRGMKTLCIDEIQEIAGFEKALRDLQSTGSYDIYCTGSNAKLLSGELATYLSGRAVEIPVYGLSYPEFLAFHRKQDSDDSLASYLQYGGLPYLMHLELNETVAYDYLRSVGSTILLKDVVSRFSIRNVAFLERLVAYLADNTGSIVSAKNIADFLKSQRVALSPNIVLNYLSHLCAALLIFKAQRSEVVGKKIFEVNEKYYFQDLGIRHAISGYRLADMGRIIENAVYLHLRMAGYTVTVGQLGGREIDFVCERGGERMYVQAAYLIPDKKTADREFGNLLRIPDNYRKIVVSMDPVVARGEKGIEHLHLRRFLSETAG